MEFLPLHRCDESVVRETAKLLNSEWPRGEAARIHSLARDSSHDLPCSLVLLEKVADHDKKVIGHGRLSQVLGNPTAVFIESVIIVEDRRGCGLGRKIMEACESHAAQLGYTTCHLSTHDKCRFYEHLGYSYSSPVSSARAAAKLLKHKQISDLQTHFGENALMQLQPVMRHSANAVEEAAVDAGSQQQSNDNLQGKDENGKELLDKITPGKQHDGGHCSHAVEKSFKQASQTAAKEKSRLIHQDNFAPPHPPPPPPPPQLVHTMQENSGGVLFWMVKKLNL